jgi:DNA-binding beta-propeller fold protein YncE
MRTLTLLALLPLAACGDASLSKSESNNAVTMDTGGAGAPSDGDWSGGGGAADTGDTAPPEEESDALRLTPAGTDAYVFVANPDRNTVTRIAVPSLAVLTTDVGDTPTAVQTTSDYAFAVTLNEGDDTLSIIDADTMVVENVALRPNFNALSLSSDGKWVMAWYDPDRDSSGRSGGVQSFNEVSLVHVPTRTHVPMAVGFNPRGVRWSDDGRLAVVVSDAALATIDLTAETLRPTLIDIADDPVSAPPAEEVELATDGGYAFVRQFGADSILAVDLATRAVEGIPVGANPTDMDLSPDGRSLTIVSRGARELRVLDAGNPFGDADVIDLPDAYGSLLYAGDRAILTTNAQALSKFGVWDPATGEVTERSLVKPVASVGTNPAGGSLLVFHTRTNAADADTTSPFYNEWALTLIDLGDFRQNPMVLPAEPSGYATSDDGRYGFFVMDNQKYLETLHFDTLLYDEVRIPSAPVYLGVLPGSATAWVSQQHDLGRISFYDPDGGALDTLTGFELNAGIEH